MDPTGTEYEFCAQGAGCSTISDRTFDGIFENPGAGFRFGGSKTEGAVWALVDGKWTCAGSYRQLSVDASPFAVLAAIEEAGGRAKPMEGVVATGMAVGGAVAVSGAIAGSSVAAGFSRLTPQAVAALIASGRLSAAALRDFAIRAPHLLRGASNYLFARGANKGLLNRNDWIRVGFGWNNKIKSEVFRIAIGNSQSKIHWHMDLWRR